MDSRFRGNDSGRRGDDSGMTERNCILVVYLLAFDDITCYNADTFKMSAPSPSGAAKFYVQLNYKHKVYY